MSILKNEALWISFPSEKYILNMQQGAYLLTDMHPHDENTRSCKEGCVWLRRGCSADVIWLFWTEGEKMSDVRSGVCDLLLLFLPFLPLFCPSLFPWGFSHFSIYPGLITLRPLPTAARPVCRFVRFNARLHLATLSKGKILLNTSLTRI